MSSTPDDPAFPTLEDLDAHFGGDPDWLRFRKFLEVGPVPQTRPHLGACLMWAGGVSTPHNYGAFKAARADGHKVSQRSHKWLWQQLNGPVPDGLELGHLCHDPQVCPPGMGCPHRLCVVHVTPQTRRENLMAGGTPAAINAARTECSGVYGPHDLTDPDNVYIRPGTNHRECRACAKVAARLHQSKVRATRRAMRARLPVQLTLVDL